MKWRKVGEMEPMYKEDRKADPIEVNHVDGKVILILVQFLRANEHVPKVVPFLVEWHAYYIQPKEVALMGEHGCWQHVYSQNSFSYNNSYYKIVAWMPLEEFEQSYQDLI